MASHVELCPRRVGAVRPTCADRVVGLPGRRVVCSFFVIFITSVAICVLPTQYINGAGATLALTSLLFGAERALPRSLWPTLLVSDTVLSSPIRHLQYSPVRKNLVFVNGEEWSAAADKSTGRVAHSQFAQSSISR